jgi:hypothetical protein
MFTNDTFQGREDSRFIPISDQWGSSPKVPLVAETSHRHSFKYDIPEGSEIKVKKSQKPENYHRKNVLSDSNGKAVTTELIEDIFHSWESWGDHPNPHNARREVVQGRYYFDFPASWLNAGTVARAVALRSISVPALPVSFSMSLRFQWDGNTQDVQIFLSIPKKYSIDQAMSAIAKTVNKVLPAAFPSQLCYGWFLESNEAQLFLREKDGSNPTGHLIIRHVDEGFQFLFNVTDEELPDVYAALDRWTFIQVWDRKTIFVHASFVNNASFHYLGTDGEFYTTPSKTYYQTFTGNDFEIFLSTDGVNPISLPYQDFSIELSFMIDRKHFQE